MKNVQATHPRHSAQALSFPPRQVFDYPQQHPSDTVNGVCAIARHLGTHYVKAAGWLEAGRKAPRPPRAARPAGMPPAPGELPDDYQVTMLRLGEALPCADMESRHDWLAMGMALHDYTLGGDDGLSVWIAGSDEDAEAECIAQWQTFAAGRGITIASLFKGAYDGGWDGGSGLLPIFDEDPRAWEAEIAAVCSTPFRETSRTREYDPKRPGIRRPWKPMWPGGSSTGQSRGARGHLIPRPRRLPSLTSA